jgi:hypothetical protein
MFVDLDCFFVSGCPASYLLLPLSVIRCFLLQYIFTTHVPSVELFLCFLHFHKKTSSWNSSSLFVAKMTQRKKERKKIMILNPFIFLYVTLSNFSMYLSLSFLHSYYCVSSAHLAT